ncbi:hypothetical protein ACJ41O_007186 [Fusarium nematophilum]
MCTEEVVEHRFVECDTPRYARPGKEKQCAESFQKYLVDGDASCTFQKVIVRVPVRKEDCWKCKEEEERKRGQEQQ